MSTSTTGAGRFAACLLASVLFIAAPALAQQTGTVAGTVSTTEGKPVSAASVFIPGTQLGTLTGNDGGYTLSNVPSGSQTLKVQVLGFKPVTRTVNVTAGGTVTADFTLNVDALNMEEIVVTGTATPVKKIESSTAITTITSSEINQKAPQSTADLVKVVPGFYVESSGGQGGNNVWARGIPQDGSFRYVAMYQDGLPVYESPELAFANIDELFRVDETVKTMEAVRGGASSIFASNAPGGLINFVSKTGGDELKGVAKLTAGDYDLFRADVDYGGPITDNWRFNVGGFWRFDNGIRDPGFPADRGGQLKANLTRLFQNGYVRLYGTFMDEKDIFYLPVPLQNPTSPEGIPGFDPNFGTMTSLDAALVKIPTPDGNVRSLDMKNGVHSVYRSVGAEASFDFGNGWNLKEHARVMSANIDFNALFSLFNPADAQTFGDSVARANGGSGYSYSYTHFPGIAFNPATANGNGLIGVEGWWNVQKPLTNFSNDLRITKDLTDHKLTGGFYFSEYGADELWNFNNVMLEIRNQPRLLDLAILNAAGDTVTMYTKNGFTQYGNFYRNASSNAYLYALYLQDEWQATDRLRIDAGGRWEHDFFTGNVEKHQPVNMGDPTTLADNAMDWGTGDFLPYAFDFHRLAGSLGVNYSLSDQLAFYGRVSKGFRMPDFDNWTDGSVTTKGDVQNVFQAEGGVKFGSPMLGIFATVFFTRLTDIPFTDEVIDPSTNQLVTLRRFANTRTPGLETEVVFKHPSGFGLNVISTLQQAEYTGFRFDQSQLAQEFQSYDFNGNRVRRVPDVLFTVTPSYEAPIPSGTFRLFTTVHFTGKRYVDDANQVTLPKWATLDAGFSFDASRNVTIQAKASNLTNTIGLTEGNPRVGQVVGVSQNIYLARPILGRSLQGSVAYHF